MRGMLAAIIVGAVVVVGAVFLLSGGEDAPREPAVAPEPPIVRPEARPAPRDSGQSSRVEDRLGQIRDEHDRRKLGAVPEARERQLPPSRDAAPPAIRLDPDVDELDEEDLAEIAELRQVLLTHPDPDERIGAVLMLSGNDDPESLRALMDAMNDPDPEVRLAVVEGLGDYADQIAPEVLLPALEDSDAEVRFEALGIIGDMEHPQAMIYVRRALDDPDEDVRSLAEGIVEFEEEN